MMYKCKTTRNYTPLRGFLHHLIPPWSDIPIFLAVARNGTLTGAAKALKLDRTTVARRMENVERAIGNVLFDRKDGRLVLTVDGKQVFSAAEVAEQELMTLGKGFESRSHKSGKITVSLSEHLLLSLADCFAQFIEQHPDILLELSATDRHVDLKYFEADILLRMSRRAPLRLESRHIGRPIFSIFRKKNALNSMSCYISLVGEANVSKLLLKHQPDAKTIAAVNGVVSMRDMIATGVGVGVLPRFFADQDPRIERCFDIPPVDGGLYIVYLPEQSRLHRIKAFVEFVEAYLRKMDGFDHNQ